MMKRVTRGPIHLLVEEGSMNQAARLSGPVFKKYTLELRTEMQRTKMEIRGRDGLEDQTRLNAARLREIINDGERPTEAEHRAICRGLPRMKHHAALLLEWDKEKLSKKTEPMVTPVYDPKNGMRFSETDDVVGVMEDIRNNRLVTAEELHAKALIEERQAHSESKDAKEGLVRLAVETVTPTMIAKGQVVVVDHKLPTIKPKTFGEYLRAYREAEGLRGLDVADLVGVAQGSYSQWENDICLPVAEHYDRLVELYPGLRHAPRPKVRDIPKPVGNPGINHSRDSEVDMNSAPQSAPTSVVQPVGASSPQELIKFGMQLGEARSQVGNKMPAVLALLRQAVAAGLNVHAVITALESM